MKKEYILSFLTIYCYLLLSLSYSYGATPPIANTTSPSRIDSNSMTLVASSSPLLANFYALIQQGDQYHVQKDDHSAMITYQKALQEYTQVFSEKTLLLATIYDKLGTSCLALRAYPQSYHYLGQALMIRLSFLAIVTSFHNEILRKPTAKPLARVSII